MAQWRASADAHRCCASRWPGPFLLPCLAIESWSVCSSLNPLSLANRHVHPQDQEAVQRLADAAQLGQAQLGAPRRALDHDQEHQRAARARRPAGAYVGGARGTTGGLAGWACGWGAGGDGAPPARWAQGWWWWCGGRGGLARVARAVCDGVGCASAGGPRGARRLDTWTNPCRPCIVSSPVWLWCPSAALFSPRLSSPPFPLPSPSAAADVANKSMRLAQESKKYAAQARHANRMRLVRQYVPLGVVGLIVLAALVWVVRSRG